MEFWAPDKQMSFSIPDEWWNFADMNNFSSEGGGYYPYSDADDVSIVELAEIEPPKRDSKVPPFKKYKMVPILLGFTSPECALPPVKVREAEGEATYKYQVTNGYHRYYASVAVGYKYLPVVFWKPHEFEKL